MTDFPIDPAAAPLGFIVNPQTGRGAATGGNMPVTARTPLVCSDERHAAKVADLQRQLDAARRMLSPDDLRLVDEMAATVEQYMERSARAEVDRDGAYRERAQLLALLAALHPSVIAPAPDVDEPGWQILYLRIGGKQATWHIAPRDADLYAHVEHAPVDDRRAQWDGHTTEEKYAHIGGHAARLYADARGQVGTPLPGAEASIARVRALAERWRYIGDRKHGPLRELLAALDESARTTPNNPATSADTADNSERCCVCGDTSVTYHNYRERPFCGPCSNCPCGQDVCVRTGINDPAVSQAAAERGRIASVLAEALAVFTTVVRDERGGIVAYLAQGAVHPDDMDRWRAALTKET